MPRGSFHEDLNDLLVRFAHRREHEELRVEQLNKAQAEAQEAERCRNYRLNQALFEHSESCGSQQRIRSFGGR